MTKREFLSELRDALYGLTQTEIEERLLFYSEMIDDRMEEGLFEEDAVREIGDVREIAEQIRAEAVPPHADEKGETKGAKEAKEGKEAKTRRRRLGTGEILLLVLGFPVWLPLLLAAAVVLLAVFIVLFAAVIVFFAVDVALAALLIGGVAGGIVLLILWNVPLGLTLFGAGLLCGGLAILLFFGSLAATKGILCLVRATVRGIGALFFRREESV